MVIFDENICYRGGRHGAKEWVVPPVHPIPNNETDDDAQRCCRTDKLYRPHVESTGQLHWSASSQIHPSGSCPLDLQCLRKRLGRGCCSPLRRSCPTWLLADKCFPVTNRFRNVHGNRHLTGILPS